MVKLNDGSNGFLTLVTSAGLGTSRGAGESCASSDATCAAAGGAVGGVQGASFEKEG
jgi:hypothetical protein